MSSRFKTMIAVTVAFVCSASPAFATDVTAASNMRGIQGNVNGDGLINFDQTGTLAMDAGATAVNTITVQNGVTATINWNTSSNAIVFADAAGVITLLRNSTITFTNGGANNGFDFATTAGTGAARTLTITSSSAGSLGADLAGNILILGRGNTVVFAASGGAADALDTVTINDNTTAAPTIDVDATLAIDTLTITNAGDDVDFNIANGLTCTVTDAATLAGNSILEVIVDATANDDILAFTGGLTLNGTSTLRFTNDTGRVNGTVTAGADGVTIDVDNTATIATLTPTQDATIDIADGEQLTIVNAVTIPDASTLTFAGTNNAAAETLVFTGGLTLGGGTSGTFQTTTDTSNALVVTGTIAPAAGSTLDIDADRHDHGRHQHADPGRHRNALARGRHHGNNHRQWWRDVERSAGPSRREQHHDLRRHGQHNGHYTGQRPERRGQRAQ